MPVQARLKSSQEMTIGALARLVGVRCSAIRYYESLGLMPAPRRIAGRRIYQRADIDRLNAIVTARALGFGVRDLTRLATASPTQLRQAAQRKAAAHRKTAEAAAAAADRLDLLALCACAELSTCTLAGVM